LDLPQAMASALMEACEGFHAEEIGCCGTLPTAFWRARNPLSIRLGCAPAVGGSIPTDRFLDRRLRFAFARSVLGSGEIVHTDYTLAQPDGLLSLRVQRTCLRNRQRRHKQRHALDHFVKRGVTASIN